MAPTPVDAAVDPNHVLNVVKSESIVLAEGFDPGDPVQVTVERNGVVIGTATGAAEELDPARFPGVGMFEVNHLAEPTVCWDEPNTPEILAGDLVTVTSGAIVDTTVVSGIEVTGAEGSSGVTQVDADTVEVTGQISGTPPPVSTLSVETRSLSPTRVRLAAPGDGTLTYDDPVNAPGDFTATFNGLTATEVQSALNSFEVAALHLREDNEITTDVFGAEAGSEDPACPPVVRRAVTSFNKPAINVANQATDLVVQGVSQNSSAVSIALDDDDANTPGTAGVTKSATLSAPDANGGQTWSVTFTAAELAGLNGTITAAGAYTDSTTSNVLAGATRTILKDLVAPDVPTATPAAGSYPNAQSVTLNASEEADTIRYRVQPLGGTLEPSTASARFNPGSPITVSSSQRISARVYDAAGNSSSTVHLDYTIVQAVAPGAPTNVRGTPGNGQVDLTWTPPSNTGGAAITGYTIRAFSVQPTKTMTVGATPQATFTGLTNGVQYSFDVAATNIAGTGAPSATSGTVIPVAPPAATRPGPPVIGTAAAGTAGGAITATARWTAPTSTGGSPITGYRVFALRMGGAGTVLQTIQSAVLPANARSLNMSLPRTGNYRFQVVAINGVGTSNRSARSNLVAGR